MDDVTKEQALDIFDQVDNANVDKTTATINNLNELPSTKPVVMTPKLGQFAKRDPANESLVLDDSEKYSDIERFFGKTFLEPEKKLKSSDLYRDAFSTMLYDNDYKGLTPIKNDLERDSAVDRMVENERLVQQLSIYDKKDDFWIDAVPGAVGMVTGIADALMSNKSVAAVSAGGGLLLGGPAGAFVAPIAITSAKDNFEITAGQIYKEAWFDLSDEDKAKVTQDEVMYIAVGAGAISGGLEYIGAGKLASTAKEAAVKSKVLQSISNKTIIQSIKKGLTKGSLLSGLSAIGKTVLTQFKEQGLTEGAQSVVEQSAKILANPNKEFTADEVKGIFTSDDFLKSIMIGTVAGAATHYVSSVVPMPTTTGDGTMQIGEQVIPPEGLPEQTQKNQAEIEKPEPVRLLEQRLEFEKTRLQIMKQEIDEINKTEQSVSIKDTDAHQEVLNNIIDPDKKYYVNQAAIDKMNESRQGFYDSFEKITGHKLNENSDIYGISGRELLQLYKENPDIASNVSLNPNQPSLKTVDDAIDTYLKNQIKLNELLDRKGQDQITPEQQAQIDAEINDIVKESLAGIDNKLDYVTRPSIDRALQEQIDAKDVNAIDQGILEMRNGFVQQIIQTEKENEFKAISLDVQVEMDNQYQVIEKEIADRNFTVEESFDPDQKPSQEVIDIVRQTNPNYEQLSDEVVITNTLANHNRQAPASIIAFDPKTLPEKYQGINRDPRIRKKGVFVPGGLDWKYADQVAKSFGFENVDQFVFDLKNNLTKDEYRERRFDESLKVQFEQSTADLASTKSDWANAYQKAENMLGEIATLMREQPATVKKLIKRLGRQITPFKRMVTQSTFLTYAIKTKDLNPSIYRRNQINFEAKAADALVSGRFLDFWRYKEKQALNVLIEKNVINLRKTIESRVRKVKSLSTSDNMDILYKAGPEFVNAFNSLKNMMNSQPFTANNIDQLIRIFKPYTDGVAVIPNELQALAQKASKIQQNELNGSEVLAVLDTMINVHAIAKAQATFKYETKLLEVLSIENYIAKDLQSRPDYDPKVVAEMNQISNMPVGKIETTIRNIADGFLAFNASIKNVQTIITNKLDKGIANGYYYNLFLKRLQDGLQYYNELKTVSDEYIKTIALEHYGLKEFKNIDSVNETTLVPEFMGTGRFEGGMVTKWNLLTMLGHWGSDSGRQRIIRDLNVSEDKIQKILNDYLTDSDRAFVQKVHKYFDTFEYPKILARSERRGFAPPEKTLSAPYEMNGKVYDGGYWPLTTEQDQQEKMRRGIRGWMDSVKNGFTLDDLYQSDINTKAGSEKLRLEKAKSPVRYDYASFQGVLHENRHHEAFGDALLDIGKLLSNKGIQPDLINTLGYNEFAAVLSILQTFANGKYDYDINFQSQMNGMFQAIGKNLYSYHLGLGVGSLIRQGQSLAPMVDALSQSLKGGLARSNVRAVKLILEPSMKLIMNPREMGRAVQAIALKDAQFANYVTRISKNRGFKWFYGLDETLQVNPSKEGPVSLFINNLKDASLDHLTVAQLYLNTAMYMGAYNAAISGEVMGVEANDLEGAQRFAGQIVRDVLSDDSALGQSVIQQTDYVGQFLFFAQNQLNLVTNRFLGGVTRSNIEIENSGAKATAKGMMGAAQTIIATSIGPAVTAAIVFGIYNKFAGIDEAEEKDLAEKGKSKRDEDWEDYLRELFLDSLTVYPPFRTLSFFTTSMLEYNRKSQQLVSSNPYVDLGTDGYKLVATLIASTSDEVAFNKTDARDAADLFMRLLGIPKMNMVPSPLDSKGQALVPKVINSLIKQTSLPEQYPRWIDKQSQPDTGLLSPVIQMNGPAAQDVTPKQFASQEFEQVVEKLKDLTLTPEQRAYNEELRDMLYSVNGYTNPEGNKITTDKGVIELSNDDRNFLTVSVDTIARLESADYKDLLSDSGAKGYFHFTDGTWTALRNKYPEMKIASSPDYASKAEQYQVYWKYLGENLTYLNQLKQDWTHENIFLVHMMGYDDYKTFVEADPNEDLTNVLPRQFRWNRGVMEGKTRNQILNDLWPKMETHYNNAKDYLKSQNLLTLD